MSQPPLPQPGRPRTNGPTCGAETGHGPCGQPAGAGTSHLGVGTCKHHLGNAPMHVAHARRLQAEEAARRFGVPVEISAEDALLEALAVAHGTVLFYRAQVQALTPDAMRQGATKVQRTQKQGQERGRVDTSETVTTVEARKHMWVVLLQEAEAHELAVARTIAQLGIAEQQVRIGQAQGERLRKLLLSMLGDLGIAPDDPRLGVIIPRRYAELTGTVIEEPE